MRLKFQISCGTYRERRGVRILCSGGKLEEKRPPGRKRRRCEVNVMMNLKEVEGGMDWIALAQDRDRWRSFVNAVTNLLVPQNVGNFLNSCEPVSFSRRSLLDGVCVYV
jgi:hypothetical protein